MEHLVRWFNTVRYFTPRQWCCLLRERLRRFIPISSNPEIPTPPEIFSSVPQSGRGNVPFPIPPALDRQLVRQFLAGQVVPAQLPLLKVFHLHYFHYLFDEELPLTQRVGLIQRWLQRHPPGDEPAWHPYPTSLRLGNWILFYGEHPEVFEGNEEFRRQFLARLWQQGQWLSRRMECHLMANHLLENARALLMAGLFFQESRWIHQGGRILLRELTEQFFSDGLHYERSLLYQNILLKHLADLWLLLQWTSAEDDMVHRVRQQLGELLPKMWQRYWHWGGDCSEPPLWGDTALDMMYPYPALAAYLSNLPGLPEVSFAPGEHRSPAGYAIYRSDNELLVFDGGALGPRYQPGHAHCDTLSITYHYHGHPVIVDTGLGNYEDTPLRYQARSPEGHNTAVVNGLSQAECWKVFRMGRRIHPKPLQGIADEKQFTIQGGYHHHWAPRSRRYEHQRRVERHHAGFWIIQDVIRGNLHSVEVRFHFHPEVRVVLQKSHPGAQLTVGEAELYFFWQMPPGEAMVQSGVYVPRYNDPQENRVLLLRPRVAPYMEMYYVIAPASKVAEAQQFLTAKSH